MKVFCYNLLLLSTKFIECHYEIVTTAQTCRYFAE